MRKLFVISIIIIFCSCGVFDKYKSQPLEVKVLSWSWNSRPKPYPIGNDTWLMTDTDIELSVKNLTDETIYLHSSYFSYRNWYVFRGKKNFESMDSKWLSKESLDGSTTSSRSVALESNETIKMIGSDMYDHNHLSGGQFSIQDILFVWKIKGKEKKYYQKYIFDYENSSPNKDNYYYVNDNVKEIIYGDNEDRSWF